MMDRSYLERTALDLFANGLYCDMIVCCVLMGALLGTSLFWSVVVALLREDDDGRGMVSFKMYVSYILRG